MVRRSIICASLSVFILLFFAAYSDAAVLLNVGGKFEPQPEPRMFMFEVREPARAAALEAGVKVSEGKAAIRVTDPAGEEIYSSSCAGSMNLGPLALKTTDAGMYRLELVNESGAADWTVRILEGAERPFLYLSMESGLGMVIVGAVSIWFWRTRSHAQWRWFWAGAAVWIVGVALKFAWAVPLNAPILQGLKSALPHWAYLVAGSIYVGLLTGVFEIGITLLAGLMWRQMTADAARGVAVGFGAGGFEAMLLGLAAMAAAGAALVDPTSAVSGSFAVAAMTPVRLFWLVGIVERMLAIACHVSSRALVLFGIGAGRRWPVVAGFLLMTSVDGVAGFAILSGLVGRINPWWIELAIAPFAVVSIPIVAWCVRNWPGAEGQAAGGGQQAEM